MATQTPSTQTLSTQPASTHTMSTTTISTGDAPRKNVPEKGGGETTVNDRREPAAPTEYPPPLIFGINMFAMYLAVFCLALDYTILATAIPRITDQFHALDDVGWYASAYTLTQCAFILMFGKLYSIFNPKWTFLASLFIFEVGSLICGVAPSSLALIFGRAIAGIGASGVFAGVLVIITYTSPLEKRPIWQSLISGVFGIASVIGPLIGGAFTDRVTWRWCFYINLPFGGVTAAIITFFLRLTPRKSPLQGKGLWETFLILDPLGFVLFVPSIVSLFLALEWGGSIYSWNDGRIIALFVVFGVLLIAFFVLQWRLGDGATMPLRIATQRSIWSASWFALCISGTFFLFIYFLPIYFQAVKDTTALQSSIDNLPFILSNVVVSVISGFAVSRIGYINPFCLGSAILASIGGGLLTTFTAGTDIGHWVGYQIIFGLGIGLGFQQPPNAAQASLPFKDLPRGIAITLFFRNLGASIFVTTGNSILDSHLLQGLQAAALPGVSPEQVLADGATGFRANVPASQVGVVVDIYVNALQKVFQVGLILACLSVIGAACLEWKSLRANKKANAAEGAGSRPATVKA